MRDLIVYSQHTLSRRDLVRLTLGAFAASALTLHLSDAHAQDGKAPKYKPMGRGAPGGRIGGATRGAPPESLKMLALAPDHVAYAATSSPTLYWFLSDAIAQAKFTLKKADGAEVLSKDISSGLSKGVIAVNLADDSISLEPETVYEWSIGLATDQAKDISALSRGLIAFRAPSSRIAKRIEKAKPSELVELHAENGYWYDAVDAISQLIAQDPSDANKEVRAGLVEQAKLYDVADFDRGVTAQ